MARETGKKVRRLILLVFCVFVSSGDLNAIGKIPYKPQWVSVVKKGKLFKYKRKEFSSPLVYHEFVFIGSDTGYLYTMQKKNGRKVWRFKTVGSVNSSPAIWEKGDAAWVVFGDDKGVLYALDLKKGKEIWRTELGAEILSTPAVLNDRLFVATAEGQLVALNAEDGRILWQKEHLLSGFEMTIRGNSAPVVESGHLFVGFADGTLWALSTQDGKTLWEKKLGGVERGEGRGEGHGGGGFHDIDGSPLLEGDRLYISLYQGGLFALSKKTGQVLWSQPTGSGVHLLSQGDLLYVAGSDGRLYAAKKKDGTKVWETVVGKGALTGPVLYKNIIAVGLSETTMNFIRAGDGKILAHRFARKGISSDPIIDVDGGIARIFYLSNGGRLYSLKFIQ